VFPSIDFIHAPQQLERVARRQLVPQLRTLTKHGPNVKGERTALARRNQSEHAHLPRIRVENSGQDLQRRRLPGAVGADERDPFSRSNPEGEAVDGGNLLRLWSEEVVKARADSPGP
jgi:hypothetical protein